MTTILPLEGVPKRRWNFCDLISIWYIGFFLFNKNVILLLSFISSNLKIWDRNWHRLKQSEAFHSLCAMPDSIYVLHPVQPSRTDPQYMLTFAPFSVPKSIISTQLFSCDITYHRTLGFWEIISLSKASTKSLSYPVLSNLFVSGSVTAAGDLFYTNRGKKKCFWLTHKLYFVSMSQKKDWTQVTFLKKWLEQDK